MTPAEHMITTFNPRALIGFDDETEEWVMIEDVRIPDDRTGMELIFRVEYRCDDYGENARAWLVYNPVSPIFDTDYHRTHLSDSGLICFGTGLSEDGSPYDLAYAIPRVRFWCGGYLYHQRNGFSAACELIPNWGSPA